MARIISKILFLLFIPVIGYGQNFFWSHSYSLVEVPTMYTNSASSITDESAVLSGDVTDDGGGEITEKGIVWSVNTGPTISDNKVVMGSGMGSFSQAVSGFTCGTKIYFRSYGINSAGVGYGPQNSVTPSSLLLQEGSFFNSVTTECGTVTITSLATALEACSDWNNPLCDNISADGYTARYKSIAINSKLYDSNTDCAGKIITDGYYLNVEFTLNGFINRVVQITSGVITYVEECY